MSIVEFPSQGTIGTSLMPKRYDIQIYQGDTFKFDMVLKNSGGTPIDVTGWVALAEIEKEDGSPGETPALSVAVGTTDGKITVSLSNTATSALVEATTYRYDVQLTDGSSNVRTFIGGLITIVEDISE